MATFDDRWPKVRHDNWRETRKAGPLAFVLRAGVLKWGLPFFVLLGAAPKLLGIPFTPPDDLPLYWVWQPLLWAAVGAIYGFGVWYVSEKQFAAHEDPRAARR